MQSYSQRALIKVSLLSIIGLAGGAMSLSAIAQQSEAEEGSVRTTEPAIIRTASENSSVQQLIAQTTSRYLQETTDGVASGERLLLASLDDLVSKWQSSMSDGSDSSDSSENSESSESSENSESSESSAISADSTDSDGSRDAGGSASGTAGAQELLGSLTPIAGLVRDHQAFLIPESTRSNLIGGNEIRDVLYRFSAATEAIAVGGLGADGEVDHLLAMMLLEAAGSNPTNLEYRQYESTDALGRALLADEVQMLSIPVSTAIQMPISDGIVMAAFTGAERQDVIIDTPTLVELQIELTYTDYIGLYEQASEADGTETTAETLFDAFDLSSEIDWPEEVYQLGLMDDYTDEGEFSANVLQQLTNLKKYHAMIE